MKGTSDNKEKSLSTRIFIIVLILLILVAAVLFALKIFKEKDNTEFANTSNINEQNINIDDPVILEPETLSGNQRPVAIMIDNHIDAMPQAGLLEADIIYEIIVEGGETRLMLIIQDENVDKIGPVRSARHYFLDYALENDAIYVHYGWSPQAKSDITSLGVDNINGIYESEESFWRVQDKYAPHNAVTSMENIMNIANRKGYRTETNKDPVLNYVVAGENLEDGEIASNVIIPYSTVNTVEYQYDAELKEYVRYSRGEKQVDWETGETVTTKNIIIQKVDNWTLNDGTSSGRQTIDNIKEVEGYYITNGKAIPITCTKDSRTSQTVYEDLDGNEINVNDGKTFIQICPEESKVEIE